MFLLFIFNNYFEQHSVKNAKQNIIIVGMYFSSKSNNAIYVCYLICLSDYLRVILFTKITLAI